MDFFSGFAVQKQFQQLHPYAQLQVGINRSIFQQRIYPRLTIGAEYLFEVNDAFRFGPEVSTSFSILQYNKQNHSYQKITEGYGGLSCSYGKRIKIGQSSKLGVLTEFITDDKNSDANNFTTLGYEFVIFISRAL